jgi:hypothetical protein
MKIGVLAHKKLKRNKAQNIQFCLSECVQTLAMNKRMSNLLCIIHFSVPFLPLDNNATFVENNFPFPVNMVGCIFSSLFHLEHHIPSTSFCFTFFWSISPWKQFVCHSECIEDEKYIFIVRLMFHIRLALPRSGFGQLIFIPSTSTTTTTTLTITTT